MLKVFTNTLHILDMQIKLRTLKRRAQLVLVPAFTVEYNYGEQFNVHGKRQPEHFQAVISGLNGAVAAERHFSPQKVTGTGNWASAPESRI